MQIVIIDDEVQARHNLTYLLERYWPDAKIVGEADGVQSGVNALRQCDPDVVLLDIEMLDGSGFDLLNLVHPFDFQVIFITSYDQFAIKAFKYNALDYILKPIDPQELKQALEKAQLFIRKKHQTGVGAQGVSQSEMLTLTNSEGAFFIYLKDIVRLESSKNYTTFHFAHRPSVIVSKTLGSYEKLLVPYGFFRSHQSHVINLQKIHSWQRASGGSIVMMDGSSVPLAKRKRDSFKKTMLTAGIQPISGQPDNNSEEQQSWSPSS